MINKLLGKNLKTNNDTELLIDDVPISDDRLIAEAFNNFFVTISSKLPCEVSGGLPDNADTNIPRC